MAEAHLSMVVYWLANYTRSTCQVMKIGDPEAFAEDTSERSLPHLMGLTTRLDKENFLNRYITVLQQSAFILCPIGKGPSSMRIFEAMRAGRAPVIISDAWDPPPFYNGSSAACASLKLRSSKSQNSYASIETIRKQWVNSRAKSGIAYSDQRDCFTILSRQASLLSVHGRKTTTSNVSNDAMYCSVHLGAAFFCGDSKLS
jgi:Exostosin family